MDDFIRRNNENNEDFSSHAAKNEIPLSDSTAKRNNTKGHISEIKSRPEKQKAKIPFGVLAVFLVICMTLSTLSGAGGSLMMFMLIKNTSTAEPSQTQEEYVIEETTAAFAGELQPEEIQEHETEQVFTPEMLGEEEEETTVPALSKGDIYSQAVDSIFAIKASWKQYYDSFFGSYYRPAASTGTGFAINSTGYIITNYHVIEKAEELTVTDYNGKKYTAKVVGSEPTNDIAIIQIDTATVPVNLGNSSELKVGDDIMVIGNALGELSYTFTDGIISHLSRAVTVESGETINMFQTNAAINNGNSGGPVYNMNGEVVGIASAKYASEQIEGLGFCIPVDDIKKIITDIIVFGHVTGKASLGVSLQTVTSSMASRYSIPTGCYIVAVDTNSSVYKAGLRNGDVITKLGQNDISSCDDVKNVLADLSSGEQLKITYVRHGEKSSVTVLLDEYTPSEPRTNYSNVYDF